MTGRGDDARVGPLLADARERLRAAGLDAPAREARLLLAAATGWDATAVLTAAPDAAVPLAGRARFREMLAARERRVPVSRILGRTAFRDLVLTVTPAVLDPRPETETLAEAVLARLPDPARARRVLDLGTGSGCLLLALLDALPGAWGLGTEVSPDAAAVATANAEATGLHGRAAIAVMPWADALDAGCMDVAVANPPYVRTGDLDTLAPEVAGHDPRPALDGGPDGLDAYRAVLPAMARVLRPGGLGAVELGAGQAAAVAELARAAGLILGEPVADLAGWSRCLPVGRAVSVA